MDESHDLEHEKANSQFQFTFFKEIIEQTDPNSEIRVLHTYLDDINNFSYDEYDVFMWTGGLGNIYLSNQHNQNQLNVCEKILKLDKPLWGSCWGLQVIATCYGDKIVKAGNFEFGFAVEWMRKDLKICLEQADEVGARLPITAIIDQFYSNILDIGGKRWDTSSLIKLLR